MLFCSLIYQGDTCAPARQALVEAFGPLVFETEPLPFDYTTYYEREMGAPLTRTIMAFETLVDRDALPEIKLAANRLEERFASAGRRTVNIDPGILTLENVCLATTKAYSHRIYLRAGIWAEVTLMYQGEGYQALPWTYPDYASAQMREIFQTLRTHYRRMKCQAV